LLAQTNLTDKVKGQGHQGQKMGFSVAISGTAERICDKFTGKTCLVPRWDKFEDQGQSSGLPGTKNASAACVQFVWQIIFSL